MTNSATTPRDAIISRLRKLSKLTTANGCTEAEAALAAQHISRLMAEWDISQSEFTVRADARHCLKDEFIEISASLGDWVICCSGIARLFSVRCWSSRRREDLLDLGIPQDCQVITYFGFPQDVAAAIALTGIISCAVNHEAALWRKRNRGAARDFRLGMCDRLNERLRALMPSPHAPTTGTALVVLKNQLVTEEFAKLGLRLRQGQGRAASDSNAYRQGKAKADSIDLGRGERLSSSQLKLSTQH